MKIIITERQLNQLIYEQGPMMIPMLSNTNVPKPNVNVSRGSSFDLNKGQGFAGKTPRTEVEDGGGYGCMRPDEDVVKDFFIEAKTWQGSVDETYMKKVINKIKDQYKTLSINPFIVLDTFGQIKTKPGMGYLLRNFNYNGKNLYQTFESDHRFPWAAVRKKLEDNGFRLSRYYPGCTDSDGRVHS